ncbi:MAG: hypothetical protein M3Q42_03900 [Pseudomonadota bacterium]|nr:hypothetical protein [Pseudomonadota bacterium]
MACLAAFSVIASDLPRAAAWPLGLLALAHGLHLAWRERRKPARAVVISAAAIVSIDGVGVEGFAVHWRGPLAFARWRDARGATYRLSWWPDTLPAAARRELRLAAVAPMNAPSAHSMAT